MRSGCISVGEEPLCLQWPFTKSAPEDLLIHVALFEKISCTGYYEFKCLVQKSISFHSERNC